MIAFDKNTSKEIDSLEEELRSQEKERFCINNVLLLIQYTIKTLFSHLPHLSIL